jgi:AraC family transcriptional regulator
MINKTKNTRQESEIHFIHKDVGRFMKALNSHLNKHYWEDYQIGSIYDGIDTITYFPFTPKDLKPHKLKIALVYNYQKKCFEIWLTGQNKQIQKKYWEIFKDSDWNKYHIPESLSDGFSIVDDILVEDLGFDDFDALIEQIESKSLKFIEDMLEVLK